MSGMGIQVPRARYRDLLALGAFVAAGLVVSAIGGWVTASSVDTWYQTLQKPPFDPPDGLFAPVWTFLYLMIAIFGWRAWRSPAQDGGCAPLKRTADAA